MCGIIGIVGKTDVAERLVDGLKRMEYRGYDSAGICTLDGVQLVRRRAEGKLANLVNVLARDPAAGSVGIAHTRTPRANWRWSTMGSSKISANSKKA
jgi:glutamine---fructose-6-phosphate transaminase (isomerizing)